MTLRKALIEAVRRLGAAGIDGAAGDGRILLAAATRLTRDRLTLHLDDQLTREAEERFESLLLRRLAREPVAKILGRREFWGRSFIVTADVLDPRPETECLIVQTLKAPEPKRFLDLGTGSGIIAVSLALEWSQARGIAIDISDAALAVARQNAARHGVVDRLDLIRSDWFSGVEGQFDLILSNPPYIALAEMQDLSEEVCLHDPRLALTDEGDGLAAYRIIASQAPAHLFPGGRVLVEIGWRQGPAVAALFLEAGFAQVAITPDLEGRDRVLSAIWPLRDAEKGP